MTRRVAIYALPGAGESAGAAARLRSTAEAWLGRGADGASIRSSPPNGWTRAAVDEITVDARRYGFHGTLKSPFRLRDGREIDELGRAVDAFVAARSPVAIPALALVRIGRFFALTPALPAGDLAALADAVVTGFDEYRAPATPDEIARRNPDSLTPRRRELLGLWGYPYVRDEFRFHLTLTDRIPPERQAEVDATLSALFAPFLGQSISLDALALFVESAPGEPFLLRSIHPFAPATAPVESAQTTGGNR